MVNARLTPLRRAGSAMRVIWGPPQRPVRGRAVPLEQRRSSPFRRDAAERERLGDVGATDPSDVVEVGDGAGHAQHPVVAARGQVHALGRAQQQLASRRSDNLVRSRGLSPPSAVRRRPAPLDLLDLNAARGLVDVEQNSMGTDPTPVSHRVVFEHHDITRERISRHLGEGAIQPAADVRRKPSQTSLSVSREGQPPAHDGSR
jgi:hypothetical protein